MLSFHILPDYLMIFPKEHLTFSNTFIYESDVDNLIDRYNNSISLNNKQLDKTTHEEINGKRYNL
ncbi:MAG TPA: hypothetical protein DCP10_06190 [Bacteroidales bacterium]|nr:hypothetical protein [Bacteroidales bacterium]